MPMRGPPLHKLPDADFVHALQKRYEAIPQAIIDNPELLQVLLPILRADIQMVETYRYAAEPPLGVDILVLGGAEDTVVAPARLAEWKRHTSGNCLVYQFSGRHFFLFQSDNYQASGPQLDRQTLALRTVIALLERLLDNL